MSERGISERLRPQRWGGEPQVGVLREALLDFQRFGVLSAYADALRLEGRESPEKRLGLLVRAEYLILPRRTEHVRGGHPDNGRYFLTKVDVDTGAELLATPEHGSNENHVADSLVWVGAVSLAGELRSSALFSDRQAMVVMAHAQAAERVGLVPRGTSYVG